uniref:NB-ARC domain containing protein n=1 Tax=Solanum tuberosum TaxID=4113 RepID=M1B754_SOLTU
MNSNLSPEAPVFVHKCVIAKKIDSRTLVSNTIDLGKDSLDEDEEELDIALVE